MTVLDPRLYLVVDPLRGRDAPAMIRAAVAGGVTAVQVRSPGAAHASRREAARELREVLDPTVAVTVDDDLDAALEAGADGVHLGQGDLDPGRARDRAGPGFSVGWSVSRPAHVAAARALPEGTVDLLGAGPVFATATKPDADVPLGVDGLAELVADAPVPAVAIGGLTAANAGALAATGVAGLAVSSAITDAIDPGAAARALRGTCQDR